MLRRKVIDLSGCFLLKLLIALNERLGCHRNISHELNNSANRTIELVNNNRYHAQRSLTK